MEMKEEKKKWLTLEEVLERPEITGPEARAAYEAGLCQVRKNLALYGEGFPGPASREGRYHPGENLGWTTGFWTGQVWFAWEGADGEEASYLKEAGEGQVKSFLKRIREKRDVDHHDMGFLYSPSCVYALRLTGMEEAREAALLAARQLESRFQEKGAFLQAWGEMGQADNYRFIIDCLLNLPLLYWAEKETGEGHFARTADRHLHTCMRHVIREDGSTWHTVFMDPETGAFSHGATCQGYKDGSAWARGQAWGIYGTALAYARTGEESYKKAFSRVSEYFLTHLPEDLCPYWDLTFGEGEEEPRDSSSAAIAACGLLHMAGHTQGEESRYLEGLAKRLLGGLARGYQSPSGEAGQGILLHGTYSKKSPYNTCTPEGVDEYLLWGDYFFLEALRRIREPGWKSCWEQGV